MRYWKVSTSSYFVLILVLPTRIVKLKDTGIPEAHSEPYQASFFAKKVKGSSSNFACGACYKIGYHHCETSKF